MRGYWPPRQLGRSKCTSLPAPISGRTLASGIPPHPRPASTIVCLCCQIADPPHTEAYNPKSGLRHRLFRQHQLDEFTASGCSPSYKLHSGHCSVHTSPQALQVGEQNIREIRQRFCETREGGGASGMTPVFRIAPGPIPCSAEQRAPLRQEELTDQYSGCGDGAGRRGLLPADHRLPVGTAGERSGLSFRTI